MIYTTAPDVSTLFKSLNTYQTLTQTEIQNRVNEIQTEIDNILRNVYITPLTLSPQNLKFSTTITNVGGIAAGATSCTVAALGSSSLPGTGLPLWLTPGMAVYIDYNNVNFERQVIQSINLNTNQLTFISPVGNANASPPVTQTGTYYSHAQGANLCVSDSLDIMFLLTTRLATANLIDIYFAASDNSTVNEQAAQFRHYGEMILQDILEGTTQLFDCVANSEKPVYPAGIGAEPLLIWSGQFGDPGAPAFQKDSFNPIVFGEQM